MLRKKVNADGTTPPGPMAAPIAPHLAPPSLDDPHPFYRPWARGQFYDRVTSMFLDCGDDAEIAEVLTAELGKTFDPHTITGIREEAARVAAGQPLEVRRRWLYRYNHLTVNNLVKEYMFLQGRTEFLRAKREFAEEIDTLVLTTPPDRLCVAVNDAIGRNNIGLDLIQALQDYAHLARKLDVILAQYASAAGIPPERALIQVAAKVSASFATTWKRDMDAAVEALRHILLARPGQVGPADVEFFIEQSRLAHGEVNLLSQPVDGLKVQTIGASALEQVLAGTSRHLSPTQLVQLVERLAGSPLLSQDDLSRVRDYASRHIQDVETLREIGHKRAMPDSMLKQEAAALKALVRLLNSSTALFDAKAFFTRSEIREAARADISINDLQVILERANGTSSMQEATNLVRQLTGRRKFEFPLDRYINARFKSEL